MSSSIKFCSSSNCEDVEEFQKEAKQLHWWTHQSLWKVLDHTIICISIPPQTLTPLSPPSFNLWCFWQIQRALIRHVSGHCYWPLEKVVKAVISLLSCEVKDLVCGAMFLLCVNFLSRSNVSLPPSSCDRRRGARECLWVNLSVPSLLHWTIVVLISRQDPGCSSAQPY